jgi:nicotinamidase-related amidase
VIDLNPKTSALVLIDLQKGLSAYTTAPRPMAEVIDRAKALAGRFRSAGGTVVLVSVEIRPRAAGAVVQHADKPRQLPAELPADWSELVDGLETPGDVHVVKHTWGAFFETDLDAQLKARGITTLAFGGVSTNMGVETTARQAYERGYDLIIVEDACTGTSGEMHAFAISSVFPVMSRVVASNDIALNA